jgi:drug/metabolite transporter (DMT)-like permease
VRPLALALSAALLFGAATPASKLLGALVLLACGCWGFDNHLTALIDGITPTESTFWKGPIAGATNLVIGLALDPLAAGALPVVPIVAGLFVGIWAYGASIALYISAAQALGATRAQVAFATAPFFGVVLSALVLGESLGFIHLASGLLFGAGACLLTAERHAHVHEHEAVEHEHAHRHDDGHHAHEHTGKEVGTSSSSEEATTWHAHRHRHDTVVHAHPHWPDLHHRHEHERVSR